MYGVALHTLEDDCQEEVDSEEAAKEGNEDEERKRERRHPNHEGVHRLSPRVECDALQDGDAGRTNRIE